MKEITKDELIEKLNDYCQMLHRIKPDMIEFYVSFNAEKNREDDDASSLTEEANFLIGFRTEKIKDVIDKIKLIDEACLCLENSTRLQNSYMKFVSVGQQTDKPDFSKNPLLGTLELPFPFDCDSDLTSIEFNDDLFRDIAKSRFAYRILKFPDREAAMLYKLEHGGAA